MKKKKTSYILEIEISWLFVFCILSISGLIWTHLALCFSHTNVSSQNNQNREKIFHGTLHDPGYFLAQR